MQTIMSNTGEELKQSKTPETETFKVKQEAAGTDYTDPKERWAN